jgi:hypothetical protein
LVFRVFLVFLVFGFKVAVSVFRLFTIDPLAGASCY